MNQRVKVERLPVELKEEVQRLWDIYVQDTGFMTFDAWIVATQTEPGRKAMALAVESTLDRQRQFDRVVGGYSVER